MSPFGIGVRGHGDGAQHHRSGRGLGGLVWIHGDTLPEPGVAGQSAGRSYGRSAGSLAGCRVLTGAERRVGCAAQPRARSLRCGGESDLQRVRRREGTGVRRPRVSFGIFDFTQRVAVGILVACRRTPMSPRSARPRVLAQARPLGPRRCSVRIQPPDEARAQLAKLLKSGKSGIPSELLIDLTMRMHAEAGPVILLAAAEATERRMKIVANDKLRVRERPANGPFGDYRTARPRQAPRPYTTRLYRIDQLEASCDCRTSAATRSGCVSTCSRSSQTWASASACSNGPKCSRCSRARRRSCAGLRASRWRGGGLDDADRAALAEGRSQAGSALA